jgi:predicted amidophosphoribosyltransferase
MLQGDSVDRILADLQSEVSEWERFRSLLERLRPPMPAGAAPAPPAPPVRRAEKERGTAETAHFCTGCGQRLAGAERFCNTCGAAVATGGPSAAAPRFCTGCGQPADTAGRFCPHCGTKTG